MMIEWAIPLAVFGSAFLPSPMRDKKKIEVIFKRIGLGVRTEKDFKLPKFKKKVDTPIETIYLYSVPLGLPASVISKAVQNMKVFEDGLRKSVHLEFKEGFLKIHVYHNEIPTYISYTDLKEKEKGWTIPLGVCPKGIVWHDFDKIPHMTVAGTTRFGKTVFLKTLMTWLIENHPDDVEFYIIDLKGGLEFNRYRHLKQVKGVAKNTVEAARMFDQILQEVEQKESAFLQQDIANVVETTFPKRTFIITDEAAQLTPMKHHSREEKEMLSFCQAALGEICRIAGALGYRNILATQYPTADCMPRQVKMNSDLKVTFRLSTGYASEVAIDEQGAEDLPTDIKGRALIKTHEVTEVQVPYLSDDEMMKRLALYRREVEEVVETGNEKSTTGENLIQFG